MNMRTAWPLDTDTREPASYAASRAAWVAAARPSLPRIARSCAHAKCDRKYTVGHCRQAMYTFRYGRAVTLTSLEPAPPTPTVTQMAPTRALWTPPCPY